MKKQGKGTKIQAIKVPETFKVKDEDGQWIQIKNNSPWAGKTKFIKHQPLQK
jgi:hypothetical protein